MQLVQRKGFAAIYWVLAFAAVIGGGVLGAHLGNDAAPEFGDGSTGASAGSHVLFGFGGAIVGGLIVLALFAGLWMALWARDRRAGGPAGADGGDDDADYGTLEDIESDLDENERADA